jgi:hypothetical protein
MKFIIRFTVGEAAVGPVLAALNSHPGVVFDHLAIEPLELKKTPEAPAKTIAAGKEELVSALKTVKKQFAKPRQARSLGAKDHVLRILSDGKPHRYTDLEKDLRSMGFKTLGSTMRHLSRKALACKDPDGRWRLTNLLDGKPPMVPPPALVKEA